MEENTIATEILLTGMIATGTALWGWFGWLALLWVAAMALDYLTGTLAAVRAGDWSSKAARAGLWHKGGMILVVLVAALTDLAVSLLLRSGAFNFPLDHSVACSAIAMAWYTLTELGSALENATKLTDRVPSWLTRILRSAADVVDKTGDKITGGDGNDGK